MASSFPKNFLWGAATSAYQIEGAPEADGKDPSIWDMFCRKEGVIACGASGNLACDHYRRFKQDLALMKEMGLKTYIHIDYTTQKRTWKDSAYWYRDLIASNGANL